MIPFDFDYYRPNTLQEAVTLYHSLDEQRKRPMYFSGGTEILTLGRINIDYTEAVIDIKAIKECNTLEIIGDQLVLGAATSLSRIDDANPFPLLTQTAKEVADRTARNKITLGGNICGRIFYREAVLPFLLADSQVVIAGLAGHKLKPINEVFQQQLQLGKGELLVQVITERIYIQAPYTHIKRRRQWETGYPLITVASLRAKGQIRVAISGLCPFPFRSPAVESALNRTDLAPEDRVDIAMQKLPQPLLNDTEGSPDFRLFLLRNTLMDIITEYEEAVF
ncbi:xanthine dehydrogenase family protein subunit M [Bacillus sp. V5-8f]|uniref:FAD binding domain-containing protein n=1 Tax=Bacillus sp. V5-8f TaxID=2053044 RepID=UPI000C792B5C|nr:FAD binding domain-containing protein [Bacillus sp. V5-8f]PLT33510.1 xanthine dehydrogenase [Bacillus sp. V5-8f]